MRVLIKPALKKKAKKARANTAIQCLGIKAINRKPVHRRDAEDTERAQRFCLVFLCGVSAFSAPLR
jgi:hypothetical protein